MNKSEDFYQVSQVGNGPPLLRIQYADMSISDWISVKDLLRERDELRAKLERVEEIAKTDYPDYEMQLSDIIKECE